MDSCAAQVWLFMPLLLFAFTKSVTCINAIVLDEYLTRWWIQDLSSLKLYKVRQCTKEGMWYIKKCFLEIPSWWMSHYAVWVSAREPYWIPRNSVKSVHKTDYRWRVHSPHSRENFTPNCYQMNYTKFSKVLTLWGHFPTWLVPSHDLSTSIYTMDIAMH